MYEVTKDGTSQVLVQGSDGSVATFTVEDYYAFVADAKADGLNYDTLTDKSEAAAKAAARKREQELEQEQKKSEEG